MINQKGQIGSTLTWFPAVIIIVGMILIFLAVGGIMALGKVAPLVGSGKNEIKTDNGNFDLRLIKDQKILISILESEVLFKGSKVSEKDLILYWAFADEGLKSEIKSAVDSQALNIISSGLSKSESSCYTFGFDLADISQQSNAIKFASFVISSGLKNVEVSLKNDC